MPSATDSLDVKRRRFFNRPGQKIGDFVMVQPQLTRLMPSALQKIGDGAERSSVMDDVWQREAYRLNREVPEIGYVNNLIADTVALGELVVEQWVDGRWVDSPDPRAQRVKNAFVGPRGGQEELKRRGAFHLAVAGESHLVGTPAKDRMGSFVGIVWEFLSTEEITVTHGEGEVKRSREGAGQEDLGRDVYMARLWKSDPEFSWRADSQMRRVLAVGRRVLVLAQLIDAIAESQINAGMLFVPEEMSFASEDSEDTDTDPDVDDDGIDEFSKDLLEQLRRPVEDPSSAARLVPLLLRGPAEMYDKVKLITLARDLDKWAIELLQAELHRLATGLDIPPEIIEGKGGLNHWTTFGIDADFIAKHVFPKGALLADFLTFAYMRPMLEVFENLSPAEAVNFRLRYDISNLKGAIDEATNTRAAYDRGEVGGKALRRSHGLSDSDAPTDEERRTARAIELIKAVPTLAATLLPMIPEFEGIRFVPAGSPSDPVRAGAPGTDVHQPPPPNGNGNGGVPGTSSTQRLPAGRKLDPSSDRQRGDEAGPTTGMDRPPSPTRMTLERLAVAADQALERAFERAGTRLCSLAANKKDPTLRDRLKSTPDKVRALALVTQSEAQRIGATPDELLAGAWDRFSLNARGWVRDALVERGIDSLRADEDAALIVSELCSDLELYARSRLFVGLETFPNRLRVPDEMVVRALSTAMPVVV